MKRLICPLTLLAALTVVACSALPFAKSRAVDNSRCHVCHLNYSEEELAVNHAKHGVGCEKCHGPSDDHCNSESHELPPSTMYPRDKVNLACMQCHDRKHLAREKDHRAALAPNPPEGSYCTDCHGTHRLKRRSMRWDKVTRKLLPPS